MLQWIPDHLRVLARWAGLLAAGGWLAIQVPANFDQPSHVILRELASSPAWKEQLAGARLNRQAAEPAEYLDVLAQAGCEVDAWETTYLHVLHGADPVLDWYRGTGLRPVLAALPPGPAAEFTAEYGARLRQAYPAAPYGTVLPFRRVFAVAVRSVRRRRRSGPAVSAGPGPFLGLSPAHSSSRVASGEMVGLGSSWASPFQARFTRCAATSSSLGFRASSHHWPVKATMPTSICAYIGASFGS